MNNFNSVLRHLLTVYGGVELAPLLNKLSLDNTSDTFPVGLLALVIGLAWSLAKNQGKSA